MKVLIVGGGGREHALAWKLHGEGVDVIAAPGNPGIAEVARCVAVSGGDIDGFVALAAAERVSFTLVGPEAPLAAGLVDRLRAKGLPAFGPTAAAARIETSKRYAKELMLRAGVPTARATYHTDVASARRAVRSIDAPFVIKASGLAAGKGVIIAESIADADDAIRSMLERGVFGESGTEILVEEFMQGEELSLFAIADGEHVLPMLPVQDHKRLLVGDDGPNTGGMGAYAPVAIGGPDVVSNACRLVFEPVLSAMREHGSPFTGLLYAGLMITADGPKVVEFNCRFGDPETQALMPLMGTAIAPVLHAVAVGDGVGGAPALEWKPLASVCTVVAGPGYPDAPRTGQAVTLPACPPGTLLFHSGTRRRDDGRLETAGGRVVSAVATADTIREAQQRSVATASAIQFEGSQFRRDIGWREIARHAGTP